MSVPAPHFLLFSRAEVRDDQPTWSFTLRAADGSPAIEAADHESGVAGERLELLAVIRGLEAVPQPARITLVTPSKYVNRVLAGGLEEWRANDWCWERHGTMVPVKNHDLWRRVDRALTFHEVSCRVWRRDAAHIAGTVPATKGNGTCRRPNRCVKPGSTMASSATTQPRSRSGETVRARKVLRTRTGRRRLSGLVEGLRFRLGQLGTGLLPCPWSDS